MSSSIWPAADTPLRDWEIGLWGSASPEGSYALTARGEKVGYVTLKSAKDALHEVLIQCFAEDSAGWVGVEAKQNPLLDATIIAGVRKCLFGPEGWPKHEIELAYRTHYSIY